MVESQDQIEYFPKSLVGKSIVHSIAALPAYNEECSIAKIVIGCKKYVENVIVVDDGSQDATSEIAQALGAHVVQHKQNEGYGAALRTCFQVARELNADKMVILDSDGQHDPAEIPKLFKPIDSGVDIVLGSRFLNGNSQNIPAYRKLGMKVLDMATIAAGGINATDSQSGFRAYGKSAIEKIRIKENGMAAGSEILLQAKDANLKVEEVDISCRYDIKETSTENPISHGTHILFNLLQDIELKRPLYYFCLPGAVMASFGILIGLNFLKTFYHGGSLSFGPTLLMIMLSLVGSFLMLTGIILHSLSNLVHHTLKEIDETNTLKNESIYTKLPESQYFRNSGNSWRERDVLEAQKL
jgi:glycosyltransferase involved in cell wall biosynthesis